MGAVVSGGLNRGLVPALLELLVYVLMSRFFLRFSFLVFFLSLSTIGLSGCDISDPLEGTNLVLDVEDASVGFGAVTTEVRTDRPSIQTEQVSPDLDVQEVRELRAIRLKPSFFEFTSSAGAAQSQRARRKAASGTLEIWVFFNSFPLPNTPVTVTIENDEVTGVDPAELSFGTYQIDEEALRQLLDNLEESPELGDWENATIDEVTAAVNEGLQSSGVPISIAVTVVEGDLNGSMTLDQFSMDGQVAR